MDCMLVLPLPTMSGSILSTTTTGPPLEAHFVVDNEECSVTPSLIVAAIYVCPFPHAMSVKLHAGVIPKLFHPLLRTVPDVELFRHHILDELDDEHPTVSPNCNMYVISASKTAKLNYSRVIVSKISYPSCCGYPFPYTIDNGDPLRLLNSGLPSKKLTSSSACGSISASGLTHSILACLRLAV